MAVNIVLADVLRNSFGMGSSKTAFPFLAALKQLGSSSSEASFVHQESLRVHFECYFRSCQIGKHIFCVLFLFRFLKNLQKVRHIEGIKISTEGMVFLNAFKVSNWPLHVVIVFYIFAEFCNELPTIPLIVYPSATIVIFSEVISLSPAC